MSVKIIVSGPSMSQGKPITVEGQDITDRLREVLLRNAKDQERHRPDDDEFMKGYRQGKRAAYFQLLYALGLIANAGSEPAISGEYVSGG
jgi:hypothetical protein